MSESPTFSLRLAHRGDYQFNTHFDWDHVPPLLLDEPEPLGERAGPNAARLVAAAVGYCLTASLRFCLQKAHQPIGKMETEVNGALRRNEKGRLRLGSFDVTITLDAGDEPPQRLSRCVELFEDYCVVTETIRAGADVSVKVQDTRGNVFYERNASS